MLKIKSEYLLGLLSCALTASCLSAHDEFEGFDLDEFSIMSSLDLPQESKASAKTPTRACTTPQLTPFDAIDLLTSPDPTSGLPPVQLQNFLQNNTFYKFTNSPIVRELHDIPTLMPFQYHCAPSWAFSANGFFNQTRKVIFRNNCPFIGIYANLILPDDVLELLDSQIDETPILPNADNIPATLSILGNCLTLEERRFGAMLDIWKQYGRWIFTAALPVYLVEHNFWLPEAQQQAIQTQPLFTGGGGLPGLNFSNFTTQHLVRDRAGIGDLRFQVLYDLARQENQQIHLGGQITFPTARTAVAGYIGGRGCLVEPPLVDLYRILDLGLCAFTGDKESFLDIKELTVGYGIAAIDQLANTLCDQSLGQEHFNLGPIVHIQQPIWAHNCFSSSFEFYGEMKYTIPGTEIRYLKVITPAAAFNRDYTVEADAESNLIFLDQQTTNYLFPALVQIKTKPGLMFHTNVAFNGFWNEWEAGIGYDFWAQLKEKFGKLKCQRTGYGNQLDYGAGTKQSAYEGKIFGQAGMRLCGDTFALRFLVRGDATVHHKGIGSSFTVGLNFIIDY